MDLPVFIQFHVHVLNALQQVDLMEPKELKIHVFYSKEDKGFITIILDDKNYEGLSVWGPTIEDSLNEFINVYLDWEHILQIEKIINAVRVLLYPER
jgi:hypothetical protein